MNMPQAPQTNDDWIINSINIHGFFFERRCQQLINEQPGWRVVETNYPVEYPPPGEGRPCKESCLDIRAERSSGTCKYTLLVECKKNNPEFVKWVFFPRVKPQPIALLRLENYPRVISGTGGPKWDVKARVVDLTQGITIADEAREVRGSYTSDKLRDREKTKTANAAIADAAYQIALAAAAITSEELTVSHALAEAGSMQATMPWEHQIVIPLILTTARLFGCKFNISDIDEETGEISFNDAQLIEVPCVVYEYALPRHLQALPGDLAQAVLDNQLNWFVRRHIYVANVRHLSDVLQYWQ